MLALYQRHDFGGGRTSLLLPPGAENPSYATEIVGTPVPKGQMARTDIDDGPLPYILPDSVCLSSAALDHPASTSLLTPSTAKWAWPRSRDQISKFWDPPYNFWRNGDILFKFGTDVENGPQLRPDHKSTPKWAWPGSRDPISKFWDPPYNCGTNRDIRFKFATDIDDGPLLRPDHKVTPKSAWPGSRDRILHSKDELVSSQLMLHQR